MINQAIELGAIDSRILSPSKSKENLEKFKIILYHEITMASLKSSRFTLKCK